MYVPTGKPGSINDITKRILEYDDDPYMVMEVAGQPQVAINVINNLEKYAGAKRALQFACEYLKLTAE